MPGIVINGLDPIIARSKAFKRQLDSELRKAQATARKLVIEPLRTYPAPPANSTYERTFALQRGWDRAVPIFDNDGAIMRLINAVTYEPWVQDAEQQAHVHQGRWETTQQIADATQEAVRQEFDSAAARTCAWVEKG